MTGTFGYMAPEQTRGRAVPASDIYSLGVTLVHLLSRIPPHDMPEENLRLQFRPYVNVSGQFKRILDKMTSPQAEFRYPDANALLADLRSMDWESPETDASKEDKASNTVFTYSAAVLFTVVVLFFLMMAIIRAFPNRPSAPHWTPADATSGEKTSFSETTSESADGLIAYFPFDGDLRDKSGNDFQIIAGETTAYGPGVSGNALDFNGRTPSLTVRPSISLPHDLTVAVWIKLRQNLEPNSAYTIFAVRDQCRNSWRGWSQVNFRIRRIGHADLLDYSVDKTDGCGGGSAGDRYASPDLDFANALDEWVFVAVTVASNASEHRRVNMYINDKEVMVDMVLNAPTASTFSSKRRWRTHIGALDGDMLKFNGLMDELRIYNRALSDSALFNLSRRTP